MDQQQQANKLGRIEEMTFTKIIASKIGVALLYIEIPKKNLFAI